MANELLSDAHKAEIETALEEYEKQVVGLPNIGKMDAPQYLTITMQDLRQKTVDELSEASFHLNQYAFYVQRLLNRNRAWERWGKSKIDEVAASILPSLSTHYGYNERELMARNDHELCRRLNAFLRKIRMELDRLDSLPLYIKNMSDSIRDIKFSVLRREKGTNND